MGPEAAAGAANGLYVVDEVPPTSTVQCRMYSAGHDSGECNCSRLCILYDCGYTDVCGYSTGSLLQIMDVVHFTKVICETHYRSLTTPSAFHSHGHSHVHSSLLQAPEMVEVVEAADAMLGNVKVAVVKS